MSTIEINVREFGAVGDGLGDDTGAIQEALDAAGNQGLSCLLPPGLFRLDGTLNVPPGVALRGVSGGVPHSEHPEGAAVLLAYYGRGEENGVPLVTLQSNSILRNLIIHYPEQSFPEIVPYPWTVRGIGELCQVMEVTLTNPYQAFDFGTHWNELHTLRNIFACPLKTGVYIDQCTDIGRIENVHFNPNFWTRMALEPRYTGGAALKTYLEKNLVGFKIGKTDWEFISNSFVIFPVIGFHFDDFGHGPGNAVITQSGSDICPVAVRVDRSQAHAGVQFANCQFMATLEIGQNNLGPVKLANCGFWGVPETGSQVVKHGPSTLILTSSHFTGWDAASQGNPCIQADGGRLILNGCDFMDENKLPVRLEAGLQAASIMGCLFRNQEAIQNTSSGEVQIGLNIPGDR